MHSCDRSKRSNRIRVHDRAATSVGPDRVIGSATVTSPTRVDVAERRPSRTMLNVCVAPVLRIQAGSGGEVFQGTGYAVPHAFRASVCVMRGCGEGRGRAFQTRFIGVVCEDRSTRKEERPGCTCRRDVLLELLVDLAVGRALNR